MVIMPIGIVVILIASDLSSVTVSDSSVTVLIIIPLKYIDNSLFKANFS